MPAGDLRRQIQRLIARQQHPVDHGVKPLGCHRGTGVRSDRQRDRIGLLGADAAVLDRELGAVPGRVDVLDIENMPVGVHAQETVFAQRDAAHARAVELGQRDHAVHVQAPVAGVDHQLAGTRDFGVGGVDRLDARAAEQPCDGAAHVLPEDRQRSVLGGDERDRDARCPCHRRGRRSSAPAHTAAAARPSGQAPGTRGS